MRRRRFFFDPSAVGECDMGLVAAEAARSLERYSVGVRLDFREGDLVEWSPEQRAALRALRDDRIAVARAGVVFGVITGANFERYRRAIATILPAQRSFELYDAADAPVVSWRPDWIDFLVTPDQLTALMRLPFMAAGVKPWDEQP
jgi:hypothetical protein